MQKKSLNTFWSILVQYSDLSAHAWFSRKRAANIRIVEWGWKEKEGEGGRGKIGVSLLVSTHVLRYDQQYGRGLPFLSFWILTKNDFYFLPFLFTKSLRKRKKKGHQCLFFWRPFQVSLTLLSTRGVSHTFLWKIPTDMSSCSFNNESNMAVRSELVFHHISFFTMSDRCDINKKSSLFRRCVLVTIYQKGSLRETIRQGVRVPTYKRCSLYFNCKLKRKLCVALWLI